MIFILYSLIVPSVLSFEYLSAVVHSQDVPSLPMRKLWHPHLYLATDSTGEHYEIRHVSQYYDVSISFLQTTDSDEDVPGVMNCECRFVMEEIEEEEETTFLQVMTPSKQKPDIPLPPREKEISIGTYIPTPKDEKNAYYVNNENHSGGYKSHAEVPEYGYRSSYRESPPEYQQPAEYEYRPRQNREYEAGYEGEYSRGYAREYDGDYDKKYERKYQEYPPYEPEVQEVPPPIEYYEEREYVREEEREEPERVEYVSREYGRSGYEKPKEYYTQYEDPQDYYRGGSRYSSAYYEGERQGENREYYSDRKEPIYEDEYRYNQEYYGKGSGYNEPVGKNYVRLYDEPHEPQIVYVYPYQGH